MIEKTASNYEFDNVDIDILSILIEDATVPYTEIAKNLIISGGTVHVRMNKLKEAGVVTGANLKINPSKLGYDVCAFIGINLEKAHYYNEVLGQLKEIPEIVEMHYTTGKYSMFAKILCKDTQHLRDVLNDGIQAIEGVQSTDTIISLEEDINRPVKLQK